MDSIDSTIDRYSERVRRLRANQPMTPAQKSLSTQEADESPPCPDCRGSGFFRLDVPPGHAQFGKPIACGNPIHTAQRLDRLAQVSNLHAGDLARRLEDIDLTHYTKKVNGVDFLVSNRAMLESARAMIDNPTGWLWIHGGPGNAKSEVLIAIVNEVNESGAGLAMYCKFVDLVNWIREAYSDKADETYNQRFQKLTKVKLLAVDEMDKAKDTEWLQEFRFNFLDERYRQAILGESAMVFASNTPPNLLPMALYDRARDGRFRIVENTAPSARPNMKAA